MEKTVQGKEKFLRFMQKVVPDEVPYDKEGTVMQTKEDFLLDFIDGVNSSCMSVRAT